MKPFEKLRDTNKTMAICKCPAFERSSLVPSCSELAVASNDRLGLSFNCDVTSLRETFALSKRCHKQDVHGLQQDQETEESTMQRLAWLNSDSTFTIRKKFTSNLKCNLNSKEQTIYHFYASIRTTCYFLHNLLNLSSIQKARLTFHNIFTLSCLIQVILLSMTAASSSVWWSPEKKIKLVNSSRLCHWARQVGSPQWEMCQRQMSVVQQIKKGIDMGQDACQKELHSHRWNCTQLHKGFFARVMSQDTREAGFVHALTSAAITYQVTTACAKGDIAECRCVNLNKLRNRLLRLEARKHNVTINEVKLKNAVEKFNWGGCRDNIEYGVKKTKEFLNFRHVTGLRKRNFLSEKIRSHNEQAGRRAISTNMRKDCTCHGLTGACTMWTCWKVMPQFGEVRSRLRMKYNTAVRVIEKNDGETLMPIARSKSKRSRKKLKIVRTTPIRPDAAPSRRAISNSVVASRVREVPRHRYRSSRRRQTGPKSKLSPNDIIYFQKSPSFCKFSKNRGSLGTRGRQCEATAGGYGSCRYLCCGRGYRTVTETVMESCNCQFRFCCQVQCDDCVSNKTLHYCL